MKKSLGNKTIIFPYPVFVVGTYDKDGKPNIMTASWGGICSSAPPSVAISVRKSRYSYDNLIQNKAFTVNIPSVENTQAADYVGIYSGRNEDKFKANNLTPINSGIVNAPYIEEFPLSLLCKVSHVHGLGVHIQFVGEILDVIVDEELIGDNGKPDIRKVNPILFDYSSRAYYGVGDFVSKAFVKVKDS